MERASVIYGGRDDVQVYETSYAVVSLLPLGLCNCRAEGAVTSRRWSLWAAGSDGAKQDLLMASCLLGREQLRLAIWPATRHLRQKFWTKPWLLLHAKCSLYSPVCRAHAVSVFMEADFARWQVGGKCANQLPVLSAARFPARAGEGRIQSKI